MAATAVTGSCNSTTFFPSSLPKPPPSHKFSLLSYKIPPPQISSHSALAVTPRSVSSPETSVVAQDEDEDEGEGEGAGQSDDAVSSTSASLPLTGCKACGREDVERGCNGEGRIQGGIATVPGFGWWPIKAYRPCPAYLQSGGRYRRTGQSMDQVVSGRPSSSTSRQKKKDSAKS